MEMMGSKMEDGKLTASGGLAPARCPGLITRLRSPCLAASGAGKGAVQGAAERKFAAAREALRAAKCRARAHAGCARAEWSRQNSKCEASRTLDLGGVALRRGATWRLRAPRRPSRFAPACAYESAYSAAQSALDRVEAAASRALMLEPDYELVHIVAILAPTFGRTRGQLRGAAGSSIEWPACRTRASLVEAEEAEATARCAWRASESSSNLGGSNSPTPNYPKNHVKKNKLTLPICKRDYVTHSRDRVQRKFRFPVFSKAPFDNNFLVI
eukprot:SAG11_NODE_820_length_7014_cov_7.427187_2_plen_271_part_00